MSKEMFIYLCEDCDTLAKVTSKEDGSISVEPCKCVSEGESNDATSSPVHG